MTKKLTLVASDDHSYRDMCDMCQALQCEHNNECMIWKHRQNKNRQRQMKKDDEDVSTLLDAAAYLVKRRAG